MSYDWTALLSPADRERLAETFSRNRALAGDLRMEGEGDSGEGGEGSEGGDGKGSEQTFTQADVDRVIEERLKREREATRKKYADYDELKKKASESATAEEKIAEIQRELEDTKREALKRRIQAAHGISDDKADLLLTGSDEETLTKQAKAIAEAETQRKKNGNRVPGEGSTPTARADEEREAARRLFATG